MTRDSPLPLRPVEIIFISAAIATPLIVLLQRLLGRNVHLSPSLKLSQQNRNYRKTNNNNIKRQQKLHIYEQLQHRATDTKQRNNTKHTEPQIQIKETTQNKRGALHKTSPLRLRDREQKSAKSWEGALQCKKKRDWWTK